jgi:formiminoglutamase
MESLWKLLSEPDESLFFSGNTESDPRMGGIVKHGEKNFTEMITVGILGVPEDEGLKRSRERTGTKDAPDEIRNALYRFTPFGIPKGKPISSLSMFDFGNIKRASSLEETHRRVQSVVEFLTLKNLILIVLGGGHDIAFANFLGMSKKISRLGVINIDAYLNYGKATQGRNSRTAFRQMIEAQHSPLSAMNFVEIGTQSFVNSEEHYEELIERGATIFSLAEVRKEGIAKIMDLAYEIASLNSERVYCSFDISAVRSADAPGSSAPLSTGLTADEFLSAAHIAGARRKVQLIDITEVNPKYDLDGRTSKLAATAIMKFLEGATSR